MKKDRLEKFLEFNGKRINVLTTDGQWWVAIRPICDALNVDYHTQYKNLQEDDILGQLLTEQSTVAADNKMRNMLCLPEKFVYAWLLSVRSDAPGLREYKLECYNILYNHFHQPLTERITELTAKSQLDMEIEAVQEKLKETEEFKKLEELKKRRTLVNAKLRKQDQAIIESIQLKMEFD